jgi:hypothetical protein
MLNGVQARHSLSSTGKGYALAVGFVAGALALTLPLRQFRLGPNVVLFYAAVMASSWFGGKGPGLEAVILSTLAVDYFLTPPLYSLSVNSADLAFFVSFIICAIAAGWVSARRRGTEQASAATTDQLKTSVTDRTAQLDKAAESLRSEIAQDERARKKHFVQPGNNFDLLKKLPVQASLIGTQGLMLPLGPTSTIGCSALNRAKKSLLGRPFWSAFTPTIVSDWNWLSATPLNQLGNLRWNTAFGDRTVKCAG